jgi:hypothetical protein
MLRERKRQPPREGWRLFKHYESRAVGGPMLAAPGRGRDGYLAGAATGADCPATNG